MSFDKSTVKISHAHKYYNKGRSNEIHVMNDIDLSLPSTGMVAIFGQSGCGKTTLLNAVGGLDRIQSGTISIFGEDIAKNTDVIRNKYIGVIFQNYNLNITETVLENVSDSLRLCGMEDEDEIRERALIALRNVEMDKYRDRTPDTLSGGQQQRVAIARAIVKRPAIILADEPTGNLDENNTVKVMDILKEVSRTCLVLLVTHEANLVDYYCDQVIEMSDGRILNVRENTGANGYVQRNKNDIWLGELQKTEQSIPGMDVTCYGDLTGQSVKLRLISEGGRLFLKCDTPGVRLLDDSSEITLREGVFEAALPENPAERRHEDTHVDMSVLTPVEGKTFGRLFGFGNSLSLAWREYYSKRKKKGKKFLRFCLVALAFVLVFMTAAFGTDIRDYTDISRDHNPNLFAVPLEVSLDGKTPFDYNATLRDAVSTHGMDAVKVVSFGISNNELGLSFDTASFMTAEAPRLEARAQMLMMSAAKDLALVAGARPADDPADCLITKGLADRLIENSPVSYINSYDDLIGLVSSQQQMMYQLSGLGGRIRIAGIVDSDELNVYFNDLYAADLTLNTQFGLPITSVTLSGMSGMTVENGTAIAYVDEYNDTLYKKGETLYIFGRPFEVTKKITRYQDTRSYPNYVYEATGEKLLTASAYIKQNGDGAEEKEPLFWAWLTEYYPAHLIDFINASELVTSSVDCNVIADKHDLVPYFVMLENDPGAFGVGMLDYEWMIDVVGKSSTYECLQRAWAAYNFKQANGAWPTVAELETYLPEVEDFYTTYKVTIDAYYQWFFSKPYSKRYYNVILSDEDYISLVSCVGQTDTRICDVEWMFGKQIMWDDTDYYRSYMMIHSTDPDETETYLRSVYGDLLITPNQQLRELVSDRRGSLIGSIIAVSVVLGLMCLCVFFIMRSSFMSRVKEVGILRAIGVTKKNLVFRFFIETLLLTLLTVGLGYLAAWLLIAYMQGGVILSNMFFFPVWIALPELAVILAACVVFGILPALLLLRKTPSEILSKYDI